MGFSPHCYSPLWPATRQALTAPSTALIALVPGGPPVHALVSAECGIAASSLAVYPLGGRHRPPVLELHAIQLQAAAAVCRWGTPGTYPYTFTDITFQADANGISHEPLDSFGTLPPGVYVPAAQVVMKDVNGVAGGVSDWTEGTEFTQPAPKPDPITGVAVS